MQIFVLSRCVWTEYAQSDLDRGTNNSVCTRSSQACLLEARVLSWTCLLLLEIDSGSLLSIEVHRFLPVSSCCLQTRLVVLWGKAPVTESHNKGPPARQEAQLLKVPDRRSRQFFWAEYRGAQQR
jgi:hypothetical protein